MKKYYLLIIMSIVLIFALGVEIKNTKNTFKTYEDSFYKTKENCVSKNGLYDSDDIKRVCEGYISKEKFTANVGLYYVVYEDGINTTFGLGYDVSIVKFILLVLIGLDSIWFVNDFLKDKKITKKNTDELRKKAIGVSLIPSLSFGVYSVLKVFSPIFVVKDYILIEKGDIKTIICYLLAGILVSVIASLIGLVLSKRNYNIIKNLIGMIIMLAFVGLSIFAATNLINSIFVVYY